MTGSEFQNIKTFGESLVLQSVLEFLGRIEYSSFTLNSTYKYSTYKGLIA